jgi:hypothetical protein
MIHPKAFRLPTAKECCRKHGNKGPEHLERGSGRRPGS